MTESLIDMGAMLHKAVNPAIVVEPVETPLHLPALAGVAGLARFGRKESGTIVPAPRNAGMDVSRKEIMAERVAVISFVRANPCGLPDNDAVNSAERQRLVMAVGAGDNQRKKVPPRINDNTPFYPIDTMFSRVSAVFLTPFFDFTTDASR